jgi:putative transposase
LRRLRVVWADGAYAAVTEWVQRRCHWLLTTILNPVSLHHFVVLPKRWIVDRTFPWFGHYRRLSKDYETNPGSNEAWIYIAMINRMSRYALPVHH